MLVCLIVLVSSNVNIVSRVYVGDEEYLYKGFVFVGPGLQRTDVYYNMSSSVSVLPESSVVETHPNIESGSPVSEYVYVNRMKGLSKIDAFVTTGSSAIIGGGSFDEITFVSGLYNDDFVFYGPPSDETLPHMTFIGCTDNLVSLGIGVQPELVVENIEGITTPVRIQWSKTTHVVKSTDVCGNIAFVGVQLSKWIDCTNVRYEPNASITTLSGIDLGIGVHVKRVSTTHGKVCLYTPNNDEVDHLTSVIVICIMMLFLSFFIDQTQGLVKGIKNNNIDHIWKKISVSYSLIISDLIIPIVALNIYSTAQESHSVYSFSALRMVSRDTIKTTMMIYSYGISPIIGLASLATITVGSIIYGKPVPNTDKWFTWGYIRFEHQPFRFRLWLFVVVLGVCGAALWGVWTFILKDDIGLYASIPTTFLSVLHLSTPSRVSTYIENRKGVFKEIAPVALLFLRWSFEFLILTCIQNNIPLDVTGTLSTRFHTGISIAIGTVINYITGRDFSLMDTPISTLFKMTKTVLCDLFIISGDANILSVGDGADVIKRGTGKLIISMVKLGLTISTFVIQTFVVWYVSVFSLGGLFSNTEALQNKGELAHICSVTISVIIVVNATVITSIVYHDNRTDRYKLQ